MTKIAGYENGSYRLRQGWYSANRLGTEYEVISFPKQTGQRWDKWVIPVDESSIFDEYVQVNRALGGAGKAVGRGALTWVLSGLKPVMIAYLKDHPDIFDSKPVQKFTIMTWDRANYWHTLWVWAEWQPASSGGDPGYKRGWMKWRIPMVVKQSAPAGCDLTPVISRDTADPVAQNTDVVYTLSADNQGDSATFEDIVLVLDVPAEMSYVTASAGAWTLEYFEGGAWSGSVSVPADVTRVRGTLSSALDAGDTTSTFTVTLNSGTTPGNIDVDTSVSTTGDTNTANDSLTEIVEVAP